MNTSDSIDQQIPSSGSGQTPGQMLRVARERQGIDLAALAFLLKVPVQQLQALEDDCYDAFRGPTFVRAVAQAVCRHVGIDPAPVLAALPQTSHALPARPSTLHKPMPARRQRHGWRISPQVMLVGLLMLLGSAALIWWPVLSDLWPNSEAQPAASESSMPSAQASDGQQEPVGFSVPSEVASEPMSPAASSAASVPVVMASASAAPSAPDAQTKVPAESGLQVSMQSETWVEIRDARNQIVLARRVKAGETLKPSVTGPVFVYIGRADAAQVQWRGQVLDLKPHTQNNEVRLQLKP